MFQARGQHCCEGVIWQIWGTVKYISMWLSHNCVVRYHLLCQLHIESNSKACHSVNTVHMLNSAWSPLILDLNLPDFRFLTELQWAMLFLPAALLCSPCIARAGVAESVDVLCLSVQLWGREKIVKEVLVTFRVRRRVRVEILFECAISVCRNRFCGESLMFFLLLLVVIPNHAEHLNCLSSVST